MSLKSEYVVLYLPRGQHLAGPYSTPGLQIRGPYDFATADSLAHQQNANPQAGRGSLQAIVRPHQDGGRVWPVGTDSMGMVGTNRAAVVPEGGPLTAIGGLLPAIGILLIPGLLWAIWQMLKLVWNLCGQVVGFCKQLRVDFHLHGLWYGKSFHRIPLWGRAQFMIKAPVVKIRRKKPPPNITLIEIFEEVAQRAQAGL